MLGRLPQPGEQFGDVIVEEHIAVGGMAAVYRGRTAGGDRVALKVLLPHLCNDARFASMFLDEMHIASRVTHENVVRVRDVGRHEGVPFLVLELLEGTTFGELLRAAPERTLPPALLAAVFVDVARGLHAAHEARDSNGALLDVVHRDVSPQNVHVGPTGIAKVLDFGIAAARGRLTTTNTGEVKGKIAYLAPEQIAREAPVDRRADLWAFGVMAWQALSGRPLFRDKTDAATMWNVLHAPIPALGRLPHLERVVLRCLQRDPAARFASARDLGDALAQALETEGITPDRKALGAAVNAARVHDTQTHDTLPLEGPFSSLASDAASESPRATADTVRVVLNPATELLTLPQALPETVQRKRTPAAFAAAGIALVLLVISLAAIRLRSDGRAASAAPVDELRAAAAAPTDAGAVDAKPSDAGAAAEPASVPMVSPTKSADAPAPQSTRRAPAPAPRRTPHATKAKDPKSEPLMRNPYAR